MGMFDNIQVPANILPAVPDGVELGEFFEAQTKSLGKDMRLYKIKDGKLFCQFVYHNQAPLKCQDIYWGLIEFHGAICFYSEIDDWWMEYEAYFSYGRLEKITHLPFKKL